MAGLQCDTMVEQPGFKGEDPNCMMFFSHERWFAQVNAVLHCHVTRLFYQRYSTAHCTVHILF